MKLFSFDDLSVFRYPWPDELVERDPQWPWEASRRWRALEGEGDERDPEWRLRAAELAHETGRYRDSLGFAKSVHSEDPRVRARVQLVLLFSLISLAEGEAAQACVRSLRDLAAASGDTFVAAVAVLGREINRQRNVLGCEAWCFGASDDEAIDAFEEAARTFAALGEFDLAIRARIEAAAIRAAIGRFFSAFRTIDETVRLAHKQGRWSLLGRMAGLTADWAMDQGYRRTIHAALGKALAWCEFLGDAFAAIDVQIAYARLLTFEMLEEEPSRAEEPDRLLRDTAERAEALGLAWAVAKIDGTRIRLFRKTGDEASLRAILGDAAERDERATLAALNSAAAEKITEQIRIQKALRLYDGIRDSFDAFFLFNALRNDEGECWDFVCDYTNGSAAGIFAGSGHEVHMFSEARHLPQFRGLEDVLLRAVEEKRPYEDTYEIGTPGRGLWFHRRVVPSGDTAVVTMSDVTAERRIETALREAAESAERSERAKSAFLASMSHEIRTPLNGVLGLARMLAETELNEVQRAYVEDIIGSGDILLDLIGDVLDLSKIEAKDMQLSPSAVSLQLTVAAIVKLFRGQAQERGTVLRFTLEEGVPRTVWTDGVRLRQILSNLVGNAVKFTREGEVHIRVFRESGYVLFEVRDTGIGIPPERLEGIFHRFQQADDGVHGGTGLGLTIARALANLMGGNIRVESEVGRGSAFQVRLPLQEVVEEPVAAAPLKVPRFEGRRILLVDDNRVNLLVSTHALSKFGCEVACAEDGEKALESFGRERYDLILMDVRMPIMNGLDATREIRRREAGSRRTPVVALTAGALVQEHDECFEAGMDDVATKPVTFEAIGGVLQKWLG